MAQPIRPVEYCRAVRENDPGLLPNKKTTELFRGNNGFQLQPDGGIVHAWDIIISDYITDYDQGRRNGLTGENPNGNDGWGASDYGVFQTIRFVSTAFAMSRHRSLAYRFEHERNYAGPMGYYGDAEQSSYSHGGTMLLDIGAQIKDVQSRVDEEVIGPDMEHYNMAMACNGKITARVVSKPGYRDKIFDGDPDHFDWVAEPGPVTGTSLPPRFAPIQCMSLDFNNVYPALADLRTAWAACGIDYKKCVICIDPEYKLPLMQALTGDGIPILESTKTMLEKGIEGDTFELMGFKFDFDMDQDTYPWLYVDENYNVVHSADGRAAFDKYINSYTPQEGDVNPFRKKLIASYRTGVNNFIRTDFDPETGEFVKSLINYPLGHASNQDYYGQPTQVPFDNLDAARPYPWLSIGGGIGLPAKDEVPKGWTGMTTTGPVGEIAKRKVVGLAIYPEAVALTAEYSDMVTAEGLTRGKFTEVCWDIKYDCHVLPQFSAGIVPILDINDEVNYAVPITQTGDVAVKNATVKDEKGQDVVVPLETNANIGEVKGQVEVTNTADNPVKTQEVTANKAKSKK